MSYLQSLALALMLTIFIEYAVYIFFIRKDLMNLLIYSILINCFTNPLLNYVYTFEFHQLYVLEIIVTLLESFLIMLLMETKFFKALLISSSANLASLLLGLVIFGF